MANDKRTCCPFLLTGVTATTAAVATAPRDVLLRYAVLGSEADV